MWRKKLHWRSLEELFLSFAQNDVAGEGNHAAGFDEGWRLWGSRREAAKTRGSAEEPLGADPVGHSVWHWVCDTGLLSHWEAEQSAGDLHPCVCARGTWWHSTACSGSSGLSTLTTAFVSWCQLLIHAHNLQPWLHFLAEAVIIIKITESHKNTREGTWGGHVEHFLSQGRLIASESLLVVLNSISLGLSNTGKSQHP